MCVSVCYVQPWFIVVDTPVLSAEPWLLTGARLILHHPFDLPVFLRQIAQERVSYTVAPPALLEMLLASEQELAGGELSTLVSVGSGS